MFEITPKDYEQLSENFLKHLFKQRKDVEDTIVTDFKAQDTSIVFYHRRKIIARYTEGILYVKDQTVKEAGIIKLFKNFVKCHVEVSRNLHS